MLPGSDPRRLPYLPSYEGIVNTPDVYAGYTATQRLPHPPALPVRLRLLPKAGRPAVFSRPSNRLFRPHSVRCGISVFSLYCLRANPTHDAGRPSVSGYQNRLRVFDLRRGVRPKTLSYPKGGPRGTDSRVRRPAKHASPPRRLDRLTNETLPESSRGSMVQAEAEAVEIVSSPWPWGPVSRIRSRMAKVRPTNPNTEKIHIPRAYPPTFCKPAPE